MSKHANARAALIGLLAILGYALSVGPVMTKANFNSPATLKAIEIIYSPLFYLSDHSPACERVIFGYINWCAPPGTGFGRVRM